MKKVLVKKVPSKTDEKQQKKVINEWNTIIVSSYSKPDIKTVSARDFLSKDKKK